MDFIGRIKKKAHLCKKKKKMAPENLLLGHRFQAKKKTTINQEPVQALFTIAFHF